jgi:hypothetical protein
MHVLVDIDNIPKKLNSQGLRGMIDRFADLALPHAVDSSDAQALSAEIQQDFPTTLIHTSVLPAKRVTINVRLGG